MGRQRRKDIRKGEEVRASAAGDRKTLKIVLRIRRKRRRRRRRRRRERKERSERKRKRKESFSYKEVKGPIHGQLF